MALATLIGIASLGSAGAADTMEIKVGYLHLQPSKTRLSLMDVPADNDGVAGAELATEDNETTGRFIGQNYTLVTKT